MFDIASRASFESCESWLQDLKAWGEDDVSVLLVGNKADLAGTGRGRDPDRDQVTRSSHDDDNDDDADDNDGRQVTQEEATTWAREHGLAGYVEASAKSGQGVLDAFDRLTREVHQRTQSNRPSRQKGSAGKASGGGLGFKLGGTTTGKGQGACC